MKNLKIISLGLGQQSTVLYYMSSLGELPRADYAIFADPGAEKDSTYQHLSALIEWQEQHDGIPIIHAGERSIYKDLLKGVEKEEGHYCSIPAYTKDFTGKKGMLKRQCTDDYKALVVNQTIRELYGLGRYKRTPATEIWIGISTDEIERLKYTRFNWQTYVYPLCNYNTTKKHVNFHRYTERMNRLDCQNYLQSKGFKVPEKSACFFCPYQSNRSWLNLKRNHPALWAQAVALDEKIRDSSKRGIQDEVYLHRSCRALKDVDLQENQLDLFISECDGFCGT